MYKNPRMRKTGYIQTYTGERFFPLEPDVDNINILDIAHALANICRYTGHSKNFYSVAEHSVLVARKANEFGYGLEGLLHDASEAYLSDISRPIKHSFPDYVKAEHGLQECIAVAFGLDQTVHDFIKDIDTALLLTESFQVFEGGQAFDWNIHAAPYDDIILNFWEPAEAEKEFLDYYNYLSRKKWAY